ncbi:MAG: glucokinase [Pseudomonadota bacterium]
MADPILVADIGGTNARFAIATHDDSRIEIKNAQTFRAVDFETIRDAADAYLESITERPKRACFAAAGPILDGEVAFTNSHWHLKSSDIEAPLKLDEFKIVNDFYALASGVPHLPNHAFQAVKAGEAVADAPMLVIGPGTGLGQALIVPSPEGPKIVATEGGHVSFAPFTDEERAIRQFIAKEHPRVSVERLLSGRGLVNIHRALCTIEGAQRVSLQANEITEAAFTGEYPIAVKAVDVFCAILGRVVGDAVLSSGARGGVILGGGILPKIRDVFLKSGFAACFTQKGRMSNYVDAVPVKLIIMDGAALYGAAECVKEQG